MTMQEHMIRHALLIGGGVRPLARLTGLNEATVSRAIAQGKVSAKTAIAIEKGLNGAIPRWLLRPDVFQPPPIPNEVKPRGRQKPLPQLTFDLAELAV